jgi:site-specific DNA recombinase
MRYFIYARKSSESEDRQVQSIDDQLRALRDLAHQRVLTVAIELTESRSAKAPGLRPVFADMLRRIEAGEADGIICWHMNRLFRNSVDYGQVAWMLQQGVIKSIRTVDREYLPEDNVLLMAVEAGVATQYVIDLKKAVIRGMESKAAKGWFPGKAPPGYLNDKLTKQISVDPPKFKLVRQAWDLLLSGSYTVPQIHDRLKGWGFPRMARSNLYKLLSNPFYYGWFSFRGSVHKGNHEPMLTKQEFDRAQTILHKPNHFQPQKHEFAFTGLIRCGTCGCLVTAERRVKTYPKTGNTRVYVYYHCTGSKGCSKSGVREELIAEKIAQTIESCSFDADFEPLLEEMCKRHELEQPGNELAIIEQTRLAIRKARDRLGRLLELRLAGEIDSDEYQRFKADAQTEIASLESTLQEHENKTRRDQESLECAVRFATVAIKDFANGEAKTKRAIATALSENYLLTLGNLQIRPHALLDRIRTFERPKTPLHMVGTGTTASLDPLWCSWLDNIRTWIARENISFSYLPDKDKTELAA